MAAKKKPTAKKGLSSAKKGTAKAVHKTSSGKGHAKKASKK